MLDAKPPENQCTNTIYLSACNVDHYNFYYEGFILQLVVFSQPQSPKPLKLYMK